MKKILVSVSKIRKHAYHINTVLSRVKQVTSSANADTTVEV